ncbi:MAG: hypothetical protein MRY64_03235 [Hyphomonadaceae bacterium]|nr:hypothetical protein [Hyphomonadaceae bacterium]
MHRCVGFVLAICLVSCGEAARDPAGAPPPSESLFETETPAAPPELPEAVIATRESLLLISEAGSIRRLSYKADAEPNFLSNFGGADHYSHWDLMRRTGWDPNMHLIELFGMPYGARQVGQEIWYIWPDLAARDVADLAPERLSHRDQARLLALIGPSGMQELAEGHPYPGERTAISETGSWRYFLHEPVD